MMVEPMYSPWGTVDHCKMLCYGAFEVQTARHGGVMILRELADEYLSKEAQAVGFVEGRYLCFEEDCDSPVAIRELLDKGLMKAPVNQYYKEGEYSAIIDDVITTGATLLSCAESLCHIPDISISFFTLAAARLA